MTQKTPSASAPLPLPSFYDPAHAGESQFWIAAA